MSRTGGDQRSPQNGFFFINELVTRAHGRIGFAWPPRGRRISGDGQSALPSLCSELLFLASAADAAFTSAFNPLSCSAKRDRADKDGGANPRRPQDRRSEDAQIITSSGDTMNASEWWSQTGSNRRPHACKARALPTELWPLVVWLRDNAIPRLRSGDRGAQSRLPHQWFGSTPEKVTFDALKQRKAR